MNMLIVVVVMIVKMIKKNTVCGPIFNRFLFMELDGILSNMRENCPDITILNTLWSGW